MDASEDGADDVHEEEATVNEELSQSRSSTSGSGEDAISLSDGDDADFLLEDDDPDSPVEAPVPGQQQDASGNASGAMLQTDALDSNAKGNAGAAARGTPLPSKPGIPDEGEESSSAEEGELVGESAADYRGAQSKDRPVSQAAKQERFLSSHPATEPLHDVCTSISSAHGPGVSVSCFAAALCAGKT